MDGLDDVAESSFSDLIQQSVVLEGIIDLSLDENSLLLVPRLWLLFVILFLLHQPK